MAAKTSKKPASKSRAKKPAAKKKSPTRKPAAQKSVQTATKTMEALMMNGANNPFENIAQEAASISQQQFDALIKSTTIFAKGMEDVYKTCMAIAQDSTEKNSEAAKELMSCKTINELTEAQNKIAQRNFDEFMSGATKLSEMSVKVCTQCAEPINDQFNKTIKKATKAA